MDAQSGRFADAHDSILGIVLRGVQSVVVHRIGHDLAESASR